jgi:hypothetical protein
LTFVAALMACQPASEASRRPRGDELLPGQVQVVGLTHCDAARLELAAVVLNGPPKGASLEDVHDATAPGCTWVAVGGEARVRLNVYDSATLGPATPAQQFDRLTAAHAARSGEGVEAPDIGVRAARFGFSDQAPDVGVIVVETGESVLEFEGRAVGPAKLAIFARGVCERMTAHMEP